MDYYILYSYLLCSQELVGPFDTPEERDQEARKLFKQHRNDCGYYRFSLPTKTEIDIDSFSEEFLRGEEEEENRND